MLAYDLLSGRTDRRGGILRYAVYIAILALYFYLRGRAFVNIPEFGEAVIVDTASRVGTGAERVPGISKTAIYFEALTTLSNSTLIYINKLLIPYKLNAFISSVPKEVYYTIASFFLAVVLAAVSYISIKRKENVTAFSIFWVLITLSPSLVVAVYPIASTPMAERYLYIPSAGLCLLLGYVLTRAGKRARLKRLAWATGFIIVVAFTVLSVERQSVWHDNLSLWEDTSRKSPYHPLPHSNYGLALSDAGAQGDAIREFKIALLPEMKDSPRGRSVTANNLGLVYLEREEYGIAESWFYRAREYDPGNGRSYYHLGLMSFIRGELGGSPDSYLEAEKYLRKALGFFYSYGKANLLLAKIYLKQGENEKTRKEAQIAIQSELSAELLDQARDILKVDDKRSDQ